MTTEKQNDPTLGDSLDAIADVKPGDLCWLKSGSPAMTCEVAGPQTHVAYAVDGRIVRECFFSGTVTGTRPPDTDRDTTLLRFELDIATNANTWLSRLLRERMTDEEWYQAIAERDGGQLPVLSVAQQSERTVTINGETHKGAGVVVRGSSITVDGKTVDVAPPKPGEPSLTIRQMEVSGGAVGVDLG